MSIVQNFYRKLQRAVRVVLYENGDAIYASIIIVAGLLSILLAYCKFSEQFKAEPIYLLFFILYVAGDLILLPFPGEATISLGFSIILWSLLVNYPDNSPFMALLIATGGSLCSAVLRSKIVSQRHWPWLTTTRRAFFYASHHAVAGLGALLTYQFIHDRLAPWLGLDMIHIQATLVYCASYALASTLLVWPHDRRIRFFLAPDDEPFVRVDFFSTFLILPIPTSIFYLFDLFSGQTGGILIVGVLPLVFVILFLQARRFTELEEQDELHKLRENLKQRLGTPTNMDELTERMLDIMCSVLVDYRWGAVYSLTDENLDLRRYGKSHKGAVALYDPGDVERMSRPGKDPDADQIIWPPQIKPGAGTLDMLARTDRRSQFFYYGLTPDTLLEPYLPSKTALIVFPLTAEQEKSPQLIGLLALARPQKPFTTLDWEQGQTLSSESRNELLHVQQLERTIQDFFLTVEDFANRPDDVQRAMRELVGRKVDVGKVLEGVSESSLKEDLRSMLRRVVEGREGDGIPITEDRLGEIYRQVQKATSEAVMPDLDARLLELLRTVTSSLSPAFSLSDHSPDVAREPAFKQFCEFLLFALEANTVPDIVSQGPILERTISALKTSALAQRDQLVKQLTQLQNTITLLRHSEYTGTGTKIDYLGDALQFIRQARQAAQGELKYPEQFTFLQVTSDWRDVVTNALYAARESSAQLATTLSSNWVLPLPEVTVQLRLENKGPGLASRVFANIQPSQDYQFGGDGRIEVGPLPAGGVRELDFKIGPRRGRDTLDLKFLIHYNDRERRVMREMFVDRVNLRQDLEDFSKIERVYVTGPALEKGSSLFFGREDIFKFIRRNMAAPTTMKHILLLIGARRMGKTSILKQLPERLKDEGYIHVFIDCQRIIGDGAVSFFWRLADAISEGLKAVGLPIQELTPDDLQQHPYVTFEKEFLPRVWERIGDQSLLLAIDEFEALYDLVRKGRLEPEIFAYLRSLMQAQEKMAFVMVGTPQTEELVTRYESTLFNLAKFERVSFLERKDAIGLITEPVRPYGMIYDDLALNEILRLTACHPLFLQLACSYLVGCCNDWKRNYVTIQDVRDMRDSIIERGRPHLLFIWQQSSPTEKVVLSALVSLLRSQDQIKAVDILEHLRDRIGNLADRIDLDLFAVTRALERLIDRDIIQQTEQTPGGFVFYTFTAYLYSEWIAKYKSLERIGPELIESAD